MTNSRARSGMAWMSTAALGIVLGALAMAQSPPPLPPALPSSSSPLTQLPSGAASASPPSVGCDGCGVVTSITQTRNSDTWTPLGMGVGVGGSPSIGGGDPGLGNSPSAVTSFQIGPGLSNQGMVLLGSAGGASYRKAPNSYERPRWEVTVKLDSGGVRVVTLAYEPYVREGDRVRVSGNNVEVVD